MAGNASQWQMKARNRLALPVLFVACLFLLSCSAEEDGTAAEAQTEPVTPLLSASERAQSDLKWAPVRTVVDKRCVVCHGCYDAPCQLKLSSPEGLLRGASKQPVYQSSRLKNAPLTRLGIDAHGERGWRDLGFFPVQHNPAAPDDQASIMTMLLEHGRSNPPEADAPLPASVDLSIKRALSCPAPDEVAGYVADHPHGGMPFATAPLSDEDYELLSDWAASGAPLPGRDRVVPDETALGIRQIEAFFNVEFAERPLVPRYIYEHLFLAHLHLEGDVPGRFFRLIRSSTPPGETAVEIATRRPFDDPGQAPFYYRLVPINGTILHKNHIVYRIGAQRLDHYRTLFGSTPPSSARPAYSDAAGGNPFTTFADIPAAGRYQFLLDDAEFFIRNFIRGPVCHGQVAVDVIEDRFWVTFLDPQADLSVTDDTYLQEAAPLLELPVAAIGGDLRERASKFISEGPAEYLRFRQQRYAAAPAGGPTYDAIWDGDGDNPGARLTVYRHFDNASVVTGFVGAVPETAWVIDFPLLERIYYDLVAGYDVFGSVEHQLTTRLYMDGLRREGEAIFLSFLPADIREPLHAQWYRGPLAGLVDRIREQPIDTTTPTGIAYQSDEPKSEFLAKVLRLGPALWPQSDPINRCAGDTCAAADTTAGQLRGLADQTGEWVKFLPDLAVLLVTGGSEQEVFSLVHDKAHSNVAFLFREAARREPEDDRLTIVEGLFASYPNFHFLVDRPELGSFVADLKQVTDQAGYMEFVGRYGIRRSSPHFWQTVDRVQAALDAQDAIQAGLLDINRYKDPKENDRIE